MEQTIEKELVMEKAILYFTTGYNCAEAVILALQEALQEEENNIIPRIATPFGGGIGGRGSVCGALTGAIMAIGLKYGRMEPVEDLKAVNLAFEIYNQFGEKFGSALCYDLTECDLSSFLGFEKYYKENVFQRCVEYVKGAVELFLDLLNEK